MSSALKYLFTELTPLSAANDDFVLLKELALLGKSVISGAATANQEGTNNRFEVALHFLRFFVETFGLEIEGTVLEQVKGSSSSGRGQELSHILEGSLVETVTAAQRYLGKTWTSPREQGQGQPPFEVKPPPVLEVENRSSDALPSTLVLLTKCLELCPTFLLRLPAELGTKREDDTVLRRAVDSATSSLSDDDLEVMRSSIRFLQVFVSSYWGKS